MSQSHAGAGIVEPRRRRTRWRRWWLPGLATVVVFVVTDIVLERGVREPGTWGGAFAGVMNTATLLRLGVLFLAPLVTWPWARAWGASTGRAVVVGLAGPVAYAVSAVWRGLSYYPPGEALYYGTNPVVVGATAGSLGMCALGEWAWRVRRARVARRRGRVTGTGVAAGPVGAAGAAGAAGTAGTAGPAGPAGAEGTAPPRWWLLAAAAAGTATMWLVLFWDGGIHWFYVWISGYRALFT